MVVLCRFCVYKFRKLLYPFKKGGILISIIKVRDSVSNYVVLLRISQFPADDLRCYNTRVNKSTSLDYSST